MASSYEIMTDEAVTILEKAMKTKLKDAKTRVTLHKKANAKLKELQTLVGEASDSFSKDLEKATRTLEEAFGVASSEAKLFDREIVRHLKRAIKRSKDLPKPKGWTNSFDKAASIIAEWNPKGEDLDALEEGIKLLEAGKKYLQTSLAVYRTEELECNAVFDKALEDLNDLDDARVKELLSPYFTRYLELFSPPE
jgi:hypothetical protein